MTESHQHTDAQIVAMVAQGETKDAMEAIVDVHGGAIFGYLLGLSKDEDLAMEVFQNFCVDVLAGLGSFGGRSALRTWLHAVARNAFFKFQRRASHKRERQLETQQEAALRAQWGRTATAIWRRTSARGWLWEQIQAFPDEDRELLMLRIAQNMSWKEIAQVTAQADIAEDPAAFKARTAALRKRFERLKKKLRQLRDQFPTD